MFRKKFVNKMRSRDYRTHPMVPINFCPNENIRSVIAFPNELVLVLAGSCCSSFSTKQDIKDSASNNASDLLTYHASSVHEPMNFLNVYLPCSAER